MGEEVCTCTGILEFSARVRYITREGLTKGFSRREGLAMDGLVADRGKESYELRLGQRSSWVEISHQVGISSRGCLRAAKVYAIRNDLPWPLRRCTKGGAIYSPRKVMTWVAIANRYNSSIDSIRRLAYKHAKRRGLPWPIRGRE